MMRLFGWSLLAAAVALYVGLVALFGFEGVIALAIHFSRVAISVAVIILYAPSIKTVFSEVPAPRRDYLLAGIMLTWISGVCFSTWNEVGRVADVDTSIFTSYIAGFFSLLLAAGGVFHLIAPGSTGGRITKTLAIGFGLLFAVGLVFIAPLFR